MTAPRVLNKHAAAPRVLNKHVDGQPPGSIYIGRGSKWGNPFQIGVDGDRAAVIDMYKEWLVRTGMINHVHELTGHDLVCFCKPRLCHGDILLKLANPQ